MIIKILEIGPARLEGCSRTVPVRLSKWKNHEVDETGMTENGTVSGSFYKSLLRLRRTELQHPFVPENSPLQLIEVASKTVQ